ncbi:hypothetical protein N658DRAFT_480956 [Parathielavia hyrcaniae]|uniref:Uncharacterized protein n=1 Tax=Parathielavia hyrcaniae TaxID=113614 RepID=A0AAN6SXA7_9PEZI|nr:hypothetical protein N658DRAFT_480956 [Parathielavia hyrcaniae]
MEKDEDGNCIKDIRFGTRRFQVAARRIHVNRHTFLLRNIPPHPIISTWLWRWTPRLVRSWLRGWRPEWFLPATAILKERNPEKADGYDNEIATYQHLRPL